MSSEYEGIYMARLYGPDYEKEREERKLSDQAGGAADHLCLHPLFHDLRGGREDPGAAEGSPMGGELSEEGQRAARPAEDAE